jgi:transglutaminase-like putative cysteine protease
MLTSTSASAAKRAVKKNPGKSAAKPAAGAHAEHAAHEPVALPEEPAANWQHYEIQSTIALAGLTGKARVWLPLPLYKDSSWARSLGLRWQGNFESAAIYRDPVAEMEVFYADFADAANARLEITSQIATQDRHFDITRRGGAAERTEVLRRCLQATEFVPNDGAVRRTAETAVGRIKDPVAQGKAIYDWIVDRTAYEPHVGAIDVGDIGALLQQGSMDGTVSGRSIDISLLFVGLCRSIGIPARPVFGLRVDRSRLFPSLGVSGDLASAQHCRAEFYTPGYGWIPVDPADVCRAIHEERLVRGGPQLTVLKKLLFGFWEMNWIGFNAAQDVSLQGSSGKPLAFLNAPVVESAGRRFDAKSTQVNYAVSATRVDS